MNISKKALMSALMALTSLVSMAQPYYHVMKRDGINQTEEATYNAKNYKIKVDMDEPRPKDAIGGKITVEPECDLSELKRSFYFTKHGNVYYNDSEKKFYFEKSQLDYPDGTFDTNHCGHFLWGKTIEECIEVGGWGDTGYASETTFYFADPANLGKLQEDLGNERWAVLSACEWRYVCETLGEYGWIIDGKRCYLIDATPNKSLLRAIETKNGGKTMSKEDFESYEAQGLVCLPPSGINNDKAGGIVNYPLIYPYSHGQGASASYWSCTPNNSKHGKYYDVETYGTYYMAFDLRGAGVASRLSRGAGKAVRLVILAD